MISERIFVDQLRRNISIPYPPKRIVSVVPSHTELLFDLELEDEIVGVTKFCIHPSEKVKQLPRVGGTKQLDISKIESLRPDLIIANKEENTREQIEQLMEHYPVWISDIHSLEDSLTMISLIGEVTNRSSQAIDLSSDIRRGFQEMKPLSQPANVAYFIWKDPLMIAGRNTFINSVLEIAGLVNAFDLSRYPVVSAQLLRTVDPQYIFLSSEPYPFREKHLTEFQELCPSAKVILVDGEMFSWYGSRLRHTPGYLKALFLDFF